MKTLDRYIIRQFIGTFFFVIALLAVIACVIDLSEKMDDFVKNRVPVSEILNYFKNFIPHISALLYPLFIFIACIFFTSKLAYRSEIIAMLASGMSFNRYLRPYLIGGLLLGGASLLANHWIVPLANKQRLQFEDKYVHAQLISSDKDVHLQVAPDLLIYIESYQYNTNTGRRFTAERVKGTLLLEKVMAETVSYDSVRGIWKLQNVTIRRNDSLKEELVFLPELEKKYPLTPRDLTQDEAIKEALTTPQLNRYIARQQMYGNENLNFYYVEKHRRSAQPFAGLILTIIGVCIASRKIRGGGGFHLALGIAISAVYILAIQFASTFSTKGGFNPLVAVWIPNILFGIVAAILYQRQVR